MRAVNTSTEFTTRVEVAVYLRTILLGADDRVDSRFRQAIRKSPGDEPSGNRSGLISCRDQRRRYLLARASYPLGTATRRSPRVDTCRRDTDRAPAVDDRLRVEA